MIAKRSAGALAMAAMTALGVAGCHNGMGGLAGPRAAGPACTDVVFPIYFAEGSDQLTPTAQQVITTQAALVHGCRIGYVSVLGLTDAAGAASQNLELSRRRADTVAHALAAAGLPAPKFEVNGAGETGATSERGKPVPLRRKTEVVIHPLPN